MCARSQCRRRAAQSPPRRCCAVHETILALERESTREKERVANAFFSLTGAEDTSHARSAGGRSGLAAQQGDGTPGATHQPVNQQGDESECHDDNRCADIRMHRRDPGDSCCSKVLRGAQHSVGDWLGCRGHSDARRGFCGMRHTCNCGGRDGRSVDSSRLVSRKIGEPGTTRCATEKMHIGCGSFPWRVGAKIQGAGLRRCFDV